MPCRATGASTRSADSLAGRTVSKKNSPSERRCRLPPSSDIAGGKQRSCWANSTIHYRAENHRDPPIARRDVTRRKQRAQREALGSPSTHMCHGLTSPTASATLRDHTRITAGSGGTVVAAVESSADQPTSAGALPRQTAGVIAPREHLPGHLPARITFTAALSGAHRCTLAVITGVPIGAESYAAHDSSSRSSPFINGHSLPRTVRKLGTGNLNAVVIPNKSYGSPVDTPDWCRPPCEQHRVGAGVKT